MTPKALISDDSGVSDDSADGLDCMAIQILQKYASFRVEYLQQKHLIHGSFDQHVHVHLH